MPPSLFAARFRESDPLATSHDTHPDTETTMTTEMRRQKPIRTDRAAPLFALFRTVSVGVGILDEDAG